jgi:uncharacterized protein (TIRG00374 family)
MTTETPPSAAPPKPKFGKSQIIATILTLIILVMVLVALKNMGADYGAAWTAIQGMDVWELGLIVLATIVLIVIYVTPYIAALPGLSFKPAFYTRQTSFMISNVIPGGGAWGLAVQYGMLSSYGYGPAPASATIGITSVWNTFVTLSLPVIALIGLALTGQSNGQLATVTLIAAGVVIAMIVLFALILRSESFAHKLGTWADKAIGWAAGLIHKTVDVDAVAGLLHFRSSIVGVVRDRWLMITRANVGQQLSQFFILYLAVVALQGSFNSPVSFIQVFAAFSFGRLATFIPVPPGGLGTTDAIITGALTTFGMDKNSALAATMVWRAATYFPQVIIGVITMLLWRRKKPSEVAAS